jgi:hypothetical protein
MMDDLEWWIIGFLINSSNIVIHFILFIHELETFEKCEINEYYIWKFFMSGTK